MTTVHAELLGDKVLVPREELERLVEIARRVEPVDLQTADAELPVRGIMELAHAGGAFAWLEQEDEVYTVDDLRVRYR